MNNMKKDRSRLHIIGNCHSKKVLLIHGMGFYWKRCFVNIINELKEQYCFIIPELEGHNLSGDEKISSVYSSANSIAKELYEYGYKDLHAIYGISLGASIALEIALQGKFQIQKLILDGGQYESMGVMKKNYAYIISKELKKVINGQHMEPYIQKQMGYLKNNDIDVLQPLMCSNISFSCLYRAALAAYSYDIRDRTEKLNMYVTIMFGENEVYAKRSIPLVKEKCLQQLNIFECEKRGHAETLSKKSSDICKVILR